MAGDYNIASPIDTYEKRTGITSNPVDWPTNEATMLAAQNKTRPSESWRQKSHSLI